MSASGRVCMLLPGFFQKKKRSACGVFPKECTQTFVLLKPSLRPCGPATPQEDTSVWMCHLPSYLYCMCLCGCEIHHSFPLARKGVCVCVCVRTPGFYSKHQAAGQERNIVWWCSRLEGWEGRWEQERGIEAGKGGRVAREQVITQQLLEQMLKLKQEHQLNCSRTERRPKSHTLLEAQSEAPFILLPSGCYGIRSSSQDIGALRLYYSRSTCHTNLRVELATFDDSLTATVSA